MKTLVLAIAILLVGCGGVPVETVEKSAAALTGSAELTAGVTPFISADITATTTILASQVGGTPSQIVVKDSDRVNALAVNGGGFKVRKVSGQGLQGGTGTITWVTYDLHMGGPVAFPPCCSPTGVSTFISTDLNSTDVIEAGHVTTTGGCLGVLEPTDRIDALAADGGGFKITSYAEPAHTVRTCDTSSFRWAAHN